MSAWRVKMEVEATTKAKRDILASSFDSVMVGKNILRIENSVMTQNGTFTAVRDVSLVIQAEAQALYDAVKLVMITEQSGVAGKISLHLCTHDDPVIVDCSKSQYQEFRI